MAYGNGEDGAVEDKQYCMPSWQKRNVEDMNQKMAYHNMGDRANVGKAPTKAPGAKVNAQSGPKVANPAKND